jgi:L-lactate dehydrogenase complex protein LldG
MSQNSREKILGKIRSGLEESGPAPMPFPEADKTEDYFVREELDIEEYFAREFIELGGKFVYCANQKELFQQLAALRDTMNWNQLHALDQMLFAMAEDEEVTFLLRDNDMQQIEVGLSLCECLVARTGSVILSSGMEFGRALPVYAPVHIAVAFSNQLVWNISDAFQYMQRKYPEQLPSMISLTTGPSRTADIEKTLVVGVHGPKEVYVFLVGSMEEVDPK